MPFSSRKSQHDHLHCHRMSTLVAIKKTGAASPGLSDQCRLYKKEHWHSQIGNVQHTTLFLISCLSEIGALQCIASFQNGGEALWKGEKGEKEQAKQEKQVAKILGRSLQRQNLSAGHGSTQQQFNKLYFYFSDSS